MGVGEPHPITVGGPRRFFRARILAGNSNFGGKFKSGDWTGFRNTNSQKFLPGRELNPGLACDRRGYSPLYYRGPVCHSREVGQVRGKGALLQTSFPVHRCKM